MCPIQYSNSNWIDNYGFKLSNTLTHKLTQNQEESILQWILSLNQCGAAPQPAHIQEMADVLLSKQGYTTTITVRDKWVYNFIKHHD